MKNSNIFKLIGAGALAVSITMMPMTSPATAQAIVEREDIYEDEGFDWGWLGLIGLLGLAGLAGKSQSDTTNYREPTPPRTGATVYRDPNSSGSDYR